MEGTKMFARKYGQGPRPTSEMSAQEADRELVRRSRCYLQENPAVRFRQAYTVIAADDPDLFQRARGADRPAPDDSQEAKSYRHVIDRVVHFIRRGRSLREAHTLAVAERPEIAKRAGADPALFGRSDPAGSHLQDEGWPTQNPDKLPAGDFAPLSPADSRVPHPTDASSRRRLNDSLSKLSNISEDELVAFLVAKPGDGRLAEWMSLIREWASLRAGRYPLGKAPKGPMTADAQNVIVERVLQRARQERLRLRGVAD